MNDEKKPTSDAQLLELMRLRELREAEEYSEKKQKQAAEKESYEFRRQRRLEGDRYTETQTLMRQSKCDHRKGTSGSGPKARHIDYMVSFHTFANGLQQIKCLKCKAKVHPGDTNAALTVNGEEHKNHIFNPFTGKPGLGWEDAFKMTLEENTTNKLSRAEIITRAPTPLGM